MGILRLIEKIVDAIDRPGKEEGVVETTNFQSTIEKFEDNTDLSGYKDVQTVNKDNDFYDDDTFHSHDSESFLDNDMFSSDDDWSSSDDDWSSDDDSDWGTSFNPGTGLSMFDSSIDIGGNISGIDSSGSSFGSSGSSGFGSDW